jgi:hypothetical protein
VRVLVTTREAMLGTSALPAGSFVVRRENNDGDVARRVAEYTASSGARPISLGGAWTDLGPTLGSETLVPLKTPRVVVLTGAGADVGSVGSLRLALERDLGIVATRRRASSLGSGELREVTAIVVPNGDAGFRRELERDENAAALRRFVEAGGVVIGIRGGAEVLRGKALHLSEVKAWEPPKPPDDTTTSSSKPDDSGKARAKEPPEGHEVKGKKQKPSATEAAAADADEDGELVRDLERRPLVLPGAALKTRGFARHPLLFGVSENPTFLVLDGKPPKRLPQARANVVSVAAQDALAAGFGWKEALDRWNGAPLVQMEDVGRGKIVSFACDPTFRGTWLGTEILLLNAVLIVPSL